MAVTGDTLYCQVWVDLADVGTVNASGTINNLFRATGTSLEIEMRSDGLNSIKFNLYQEATDGIQADLSVDRGSGPESGLALATGWHGFAGASPGHVALRGATGKYDLYGVRPIRSPANWDSLVTATNVHTAVMVASGSARITAVQQFVDSILRGSYLVPVGAEEPGYPFGAIRINSQSDTMPGPPVYIKMPEAGQEDPDPVLGINSLVMYMEGARADMQAPGGGFVVGEGEDLNLAALPGGHSPTYDWLLGSATLGYAGQTVKVPWADLLSLGCGLHEITLTVHAGGGVAEQHASLNILPEPTTLSLLALGGLVALRCRR